MARNRIQPNMRQTAAPRCKPAKQLISEPNSIQPTGDDAIGADEPMNNPDARRRALTAIGCMKSGLSDLAERHDDYLIEAYLA